MEDEDQKTDLFQKVVAHGRNYNSIGELQDPRGYWVAGFKYLSTLVIRKFQDMYSNMDHQYMLGMI